MRALTRSDIELAGKLYECHDSAKFLSGEKFKEEIKPYIEVIKKIMEAHQKDEIKSVLFICEREPVKSNAMQRIYFLAAYVEMIEPSN